MQTLGSSEDDSCNRVPDTPVEELDWVCGSWLLLSSVLAVRVAWTVSQCVEFYLSSVCLSVSFSVLLK